VWFSLKINRYETSAERRDVSCEAVCGVLSALLSICTRLVRFFSCMIINFREYDLRKCDVLAKLIVMRA
jgi:hypothetical protein